MPDPQFRLPAFTTERFGPGESAGAVQPGDFFLTHASGLTTQLIRFGESLRYTGAEKPFAHWSHAALFVSAEGDLIEAIDSGVQRRNISIYAGTEYHVVRFTELTELERSHAVAFAEFCLNDRYGVLEVISLALTLLTAYKLSFGVDGQMICSGLVARALERFGAIFPYDSWHMLPADLAKCFHVVADVGSDQGTIPGARVGVTRRSRAR